MRHYVISIVLALAVLTPHALYAGALDRGPMQERYNPAAKDMLRIPGVVGSYEQEALSSLQQAGLSVTVKRITRGNPKYEGKEGIVISQSPSSGGVAMVGSSVNITVYKTGQGYQQGGGGYDGQSGDDTWQDDGQQGYDEPADGSRWGEGNNGGGWQPPPSGEDSDGGPSEPSFGGGNRGMNLGNDVPNVPPPSGGLRAPNLRRPVGKGGGIVGQPVTSSRGHVNPSTTRDELMTPKQRRDLDRKIKNARGGKRIGILPRQGTIVAKPVHVPVRRVNSGASNPNWSPRRPKVVPSKPIVSPVPEGVAIKVRPGGPAASPARASGKPIDGVGSQGIVMGTAKPKPVNRSGGQAIVMGTAKPKPVQSNSVDQNVAEKKLGKNKEQLQKKSSFFDRIFR